MSNIFILDASPLILFGKTDLLKTISPLAESWIVPEGVVAEVEAKKPIGPYLADLEADSSVFRKVVEHIHPWVAGWDLGRGESEAITIALQDANARAVLDDFQARKCTALLGVDTVGSLGLLLMAKRRGLIDAVRPEIDKLIGAGLRIDFAILDKIYKKIGE